MVKTLQPYQCLLGRSTSSETVIYPNTASFSSKKGILRFHIHDMSSCCLRAQKVFLKRLYLCLYSMIIDFYCQPNFRTNLITIKEISLCSLLCNCDPQLNSIYLLSKQLMTNDHVHQLLTVDNPLFYPAHHCLLQLSHISLVGKKISHCHYWIGIF